MTELMNSNMDPRAYTGAEWKELAQNFTSRQLRNTIKRAYRKQAKEAVEIAKRRLQTCGMNVEGDQSDFAKGIRSHIYSRGGGFMVTVKARSSRSKKGEKGMHTNRRGLKKPVLMWAEEGTNKRKVGQTRFKIGKKRLSFGGKNRGSMPAYHFLDAATPEMFQKVETGLFPSVEEAVNKVAKKCGFV